jgi:polyhydroxybutyrate depolymerase
VIATMKTRANIDSDRVFVTGISNGGGMAQKMACEAADVVRAAVSVSFPVNSQNCHPAKPITVFEIAGTADTTISYAGNTSTIPPLPNDTLGIPLGVQGAQDSLAEWRAINACAANVVRTPRPGDSYADVYPLCANGVSVGLVTITNGRHILYNGYVDALGGYDGNNAPIDVHSYIWDNIFTM